MRDDRLPSIYTFNLSTVLSSDATSATIQVPFSPPFNIGGTSCYVEAQYLNWNSNVSVTNATPTEAVIPGFDATTNRLSQPTSNPVYNGDQIFWPTGATKPDPFTNNTIYFVMNATTSTFQLRTTTTGGATDITAAASASSTINIYPSTARNDPFLVYTSLTNSSNVCGQSTTTAWSTNTAIGSTFDNTFNSAGPILCYIPDGPQTITFYVKRASSTRIIGPSSTAYLTVILKIIPSSSSQPPIGV